MAPHEITGTNFHVYRTASGYVRCDHPDRAELDGQDARDALEAIAAVAGGGPTPLMVDVRGDTVRVAGCS